jgi:uncharacterized protein (DUF2147 family)
MYNRLALNFGIVIILMLVNAATYAQSPPAADCICGRWVSDERNLIVEVCKVNNEYQAKIIWFDAGSDQLMHDWIDKNNPDKTLRNRKILVMSVLRNLVYIAKSNSWEEGMIYDAKHGREWNASAYIDKDGTLRLKGYWHFKFIGHTMTFERTKDLAVLNKNSAPE